MRLRCDALIVAAILAFAGMSAAHAAPRDDAHLRVDQSVTLFRAGDVRAARVEAMKAVAADQNWGVAHAILGRTALAVDDGAAAEPELRRAIDRGYRAGDLHHLLAHAFVLQGRALAALEEARADRIPPRYAAYAARMRAAAHAQLGDRDAAVRELAAAARFAPRDSRVWSDIARLRLYGGDVAGALTAAEHAVELDGANVQALVLSGTLVRDRYGLASAISWFDRALAVEPGNLAAMLERAATLGDLGRTRDMLAQTRAVLAAAPKNAQALYLQAVMAARAGDWSLSRSLMYRVGNRLGALAGPALLVALIDVAQGNYEQAIAQLSPLVQAQPDNIKVRRLLGNALWRSGDDRAAIDVLRSIADRPDADSYTLTVIGRAHERIGNRAAAAEYLDRASRPSVGAATPFDGSAMRPLTAGAVSVPYIRQLLKDGRTAEATAEAERLQRQNPGAPAAMMLVGDTLYAQRKFGEAADAYMRAANLHFGESVALRLIEALRRTGDAAAATRVLDLYLAQNPQSVPAALLKSDITLAEGNWARAAELLESLRRRIGDRDATLLNNLGWAQLNLGKTSKAVALGRAAYALAPGSAPVAASYGWFAAQAGDRARGIALLEKAVSLAPDVAPYAERLALVRARG